MGSRTIAGARRKAACTDPIVVPRLARVLPVALLGGLTLAGCDESPSPIATRDPATLAIGSIQGREARSPLEGHEVVVEGVVTLNLVGDEDRPGLAFAEAVAGEQDVARAGWFIQDGGDGDHATADALYVPERPDTVLILPADAQVTMRIGSMLRSGDRVAVRGRVVEHPAPVVRDRAHRARVSHGEPGGTLTAIEASHIEIFSREERPKPLVLVSIEPEAAFEEASEGMRLAPLPGAH